MQSRKKLPTRNTAREHVASRLGRQQRMVSGRGQVMDKKASDLITSSGRKERFVQVSSEILSKKYIEGEATNDLKTRYILSQNETQDLCLACDAVNRSSINHMGCNNKTNGGVLGTIFSPPFHSSKDDCISDRVEVIELYSTDDQSDHMDCESEITKSAIDSVTPVTCSDEDSAAGGSFSSEVSKAIYLVTQQSKLECIDEQSSDSVPATEAFAEADEEDEIVDFDPYLFIRNLPELSAVVPTFRPMLLPKQTRSCPSTSLVLDLDETLVHSTLEHCDDADFTFPVNFNFRQHTVYVRCRPYLKDFMDKVSRLFEIIVFTASQSIYAEQLLNVLDPRRKIFRHRVYRESCVFVEGNYLKDLSVLGRDLAHVVIVDNSPQAFGFQVDNGIPIESWFDDPTDQALLSLLPFLESLVAVEDVRPIIAKRFNLRKKVAAATDPTFKLY